MMVEGGVVAYGGALGGDNSRFLVCRWEGLAEAGIRLVAKIKWQSPAEGGPHIVNIQHGF